MSKPAVPKDKDKKKVKGAKDDKPIDDTFEPIKVDARAANTVVLMLESPEDEVLQRACEAIFRFCEKSENNRLIVHQMNATLKLFKLISHEDRVVQRNACMAFALLSSHPEVRRFLREDNDTYINKMTTLLSSEYDSLVNEYAALWIRNVCEDFSTKNIIAANGTAIPPLVALLNSSDPDITFNAVGAIDRIVADYQTRQLVRELKGIEPIFNLMKSDYPQIQEAVFSCLIKLTQDVENREAVREIGGLEKLVDFLGKSEYKDMHVNCLNVLANCLEDTQCLDMIQQTGGLAKILNYCQEVSDSGQMPKINSTAAKALARCAKKPENRTILTEQQAERVLIYLLLCDNDDVKISACQAISVMAESALSRDAFRNFEAIETVVRLCNVENSRIREMASLALSNLSFNNHNNCREILANQGVDTLVKLLRDEKDTTKAYACVCLVNMANDELLRQEIEQTVFVPSLAYALCAKNFLTQAKACLAISSYCVDANVRNELKTSGAISTLVQLAQSNNDEVRNNACWSIATACADVSVAAEFCKQGAIEALRGINQSSKRRNNFTETALKKILDANLSAKYALMNILEPTNYITDGFYDMGPMRPNGKFYSLEEVLKMPPNDKRPILYINALEEKVTSPVDNKSETGKGKTRSGTSSKERDSKSKSVDRADSSKTKRAETAKKTAEELKAAANTEDKPKEMSVTQFSKPQVDKDLNLWIAEVKQNFHSQAPKLQAISLANFVAQRLGGPVSRNDIANLAYELQINEYKFENKTNVVPLGKIHIGTFYHRALLYKILADRINLKVSLERGDYNRAWNTIALKEDNSPYPPKLYIIDLMHEPGKLMHIDAKEAIQYTRL